MSINIALAVLAVMLSLIPGIVVGQLIYLLVSLVIPSSSLAIAMMTGIVVVIEFAKWLIDPRRYAK